MTKIKMTKISASIGLTLAALSSGANAATIDFETVPGGTPSDALAISTQYQATQGVSFSLSNGNSLNLEKTGNSDSAWGFSNGALPGNPKDTESAGFEGDLGDYYLRIGTGTNLSTPFPDFVIDYDTPVSAASAQIWDIDGTVSLGTEEWHVNAYNATGGLLSTIMSPIGDTDDVGTLDGAPWTWSFNLGSADISQIVISFEGTKTSGIGLAFDNFSPSSPAVVPVPAAAWLFASALGFLGWRRRTAS